MSDEKNRISMESSEEPIPKIAMPPSLSASKQSYRIQVWERLEKENIAVFPLPLFGRIPNFQGAEEAAHQILELEEFRMAKSIEVNPDKPLEHARFLTLENNKNLYVPVPRLKEHLLKKLEVEGKQSKYKLRKVISRWGIEHTGRSISLDDDVKIDVIILGSVAVSKSGQRIGKGKGYADLEYAILKEMGAVNDDTLIVTMVHDFQVFDDIPLDLFEKYDVPVDIILTPTQILKVKERLPRPLGIFWELLSTRRLNTMPILQKLKARHESSGREVILKEIDTDIEEVDTKTKSRKFYRRSGKVGSESEGEDVNSKRPSVSNNDVDGRRRDETVEHGGIHKSRKFYKKRTSQSYHQNSNAVSNTVSSDNNNGVVVGGGGGDGDERRLGSSSRPRNGKFNRSPIDFSVKVCNIGKTIRVRDLKDVLNENGIKPVDITWRGFKGFCYLHYGKPNVKKSDLPSPKKIVLNDVIEILQNIKLNAESDINLSVKLLESAVPTAAAATAIATTSTNITNV